MVNRGETGDPDCFFQQIHILYDLTFPWCLSVLRVQSAGRQWNPRKTPSYYLSRLLGRRLIITWFFLTARESKVSDPPFLTQYLSLFFYLNRLFYVKKKKKRCKVEGIPKNCLCCKLYQM